MQSTGQLLGYDIMGTFRCKEDSFLSLLLGRNYLAEDQNIRTTIRFPSPLIPHWGDGDIYEYSSSGQFLLTPLVTYASSGDRGIYACSFLEQFLDFLLFTYETLGEDTMDLSRVYLEEVICRAVSSSIFKQHIFVRKVRR